ncbi:diphosphomevalonate decarboxylase [Elasticomyces elasticus]|nr:diphosphomevalonate decarboxylase [Elasticomyces elasticus]KAK3627002.1 diphosphomevalonate decarboxylase [Elasticomyces elasticus]KAK4910844.1 diphosphomevalonate decarboxylase [Elasticomyces elasticus]KAK5750422.1 diphosphomevalonate decarboxylase [Elasticomyces elasticus]
MAETDIYRASTFAPVNIAVIKYWGKRDTKLNLPTNSSLSVTLSQDDLRTHTTASCSASFISETLTLNDAPQDISGARTQACLRELRSLRQKIETADPSAPKLSTMNLKIVSQNNFPTAAGLASSAAGFAALVRSIANLYSLPSTPTELSRIARQGSGSACRSLFGGYVGWNQGTQADGRDSVAYSVAEQSHWPEMRALILVASAEKKDQTVATSTLFQHRVAHVVPGRMEAMEKAIRERDFPGFADLTMRDSNNFHATCLDTSPPILYLNDTSRAAIRVCNAINTARGKLVCAYTFDAGPNAVVYYLAEHTDAVAGTFKGILGSALEGWEGAKGRDVNAGSVPEGLENVGEVLRKGVGRVILTGVGDGPREVEEHLC